MRISGLGFSVQGFGFSAQRNCYIGNPLTEELHHGAMGFVSHNPKTKEGLGLPW